LIPAAYIQAWSAKAPWPDAGQVEQDLVICRALSSAGVSGFPDPAQRTPFADDWSKSGESTTTEACLTGIPEPGQERVPTSDHRHKLPAGYRVGKTTVLGGLHHEYHLVKEAA